MNSSANQSKKANAAQSKVATKGRHKFIDKVHVRYVEKEKRHWASLENFNSQRIAIGEKFYKNNDRLLEGGIAGWTGAGYPTASSTDIPADRECIDYLFFVHDRHAGNREAMKQYLAWETGLMAQLGEQDKSVFHLPGH